jgi:histidinol-phosphate aminotransferase/imidazoleglycerol-phosphate dehydratase/histidinol-phosphatase
MNWLNQIARPEILALTPYSSARGEYQGTQEIKLDANENPNAPYGDENALNLNRYPEPQPVALCNKLANLYGVSYEQLLITRGMDEGIDLLIRAFCTPYQDSIAMLPPTFGYYQVAADINGINVRKIPLDDQFELDWPQLSTLQDTKMIFLCTPNNPTGNLISLEKISALCELYRQRSLIVVDEAYIEFSNGLSASTLLAQFDNLVVMRTLSKAYGLAGARIGSVLANPMIIQLLRKIIPPYPIPTLSADMAVKSLSPMGIAYADRQITLLKQERERLYALLQQSSTILEVYPSEANFILIRVENPDELYQTLKSKGIIIRNRSQMIPGALRLSIGTFDENQRLLAALGLLDSENIMVRSSYQARKTKETEIMAFVALDEQGCSQINTGIGFFDHMLEQLARHSGMSIELKATGDLEVDSHHTIEDVAIVLGLAIKEALGNKRGIARYGFLLPMDEAEAKVSIDLDGRGYCLFNATFNAPQIGEFPVEMVKHFFTTLSQNMKATFHIDILGENTHHMVESCFKCFAKALKQAINIEGDALPTTKGAL